MSLHFALKALEASSKKDQALLKKSSLDIRLLPESQHDQQMAKLLALDTVLGTISFIFLLVPISLVVFLL